MRITYRYTDNKEYWAKRWDDVPVDDPMTNESKYPLCYALKMVGDQKGRILEAGCGVGRILRYFHDRGWEIVGMDFISGAIEKLHQADPSLAVEVGDITQLQYPDGAFDYVMAYGLYHNLEHGLEQAMSETFRVLTPGGKVCASFRADNIQTRLTDWLANRKAPDKGKGGKAFHKMNLTRQEYLSLFTDAGFHVLEDYPVENMPILYKFRCFRAKGHKEFNENLGRREGYRLSFLGQRLQNALMRYFPFQFCNILVVIAQRPDDN